MSDDYLWDGAGPSDPDVERLERLLAPLRSTPPLRRRVQRRKPARAALVCALAAAAALLLALALWWSPAPASGPLAATTGWAINRLSGSPLADGKPVGGERPLAIGETVATDPHSRAQISSEDVGQVVLYPGSRVRLVEAAGGRHRLALERGALQAFIVAPPGRFVVDTPSATAVDLGCVYTLRVNEAGDGTVSVQAGWVAFEFRGRESFVPAGASCPTSAKRGPGLPRFDDAAAPFVRAIDDLERNQAPGARAASLQTALREARPRDAVTLWHLLPRVSDRERHDVLAALDARVPLPRGTTADAVFQLQGPALDRWWNALGLGDIRFWRQWKRPL